MSVNKQTEFFDKVDVSVSIAKLIFSYLEETYPCRTISDVAITTSGGTPLRGHSGYYGGKIPWIKSGELNDGIITEFEETITEEGLKNSSAKVYPKGTLVLALYGATAGKTGIVDFDTASNQAVAAVYPNEEIERDYLFWFFRQKRFDYIQISFGAAQPNISQTVVKATKIAVPEKDIQKEVVDFLNVIETERELTWKNSLVPVWNKLKGFYNLYQTRQTLLKELDHQQTYLQLLRQTILQEAVQGKLTKQDLTDKPATELLKRIKAEKEKLIKAGKFKKEKELSPITEDEIPFELPEGWVWCRLGEITKLQNGYAFQSAKYQKEGIRLVRNINISHGNINWDERACYPVALRGEFVDFEVNESDILISLDRPLISTGLKIARVSSTDIPSLLLQRVARVNSRNLKINDSYVYLWFTSPLFIDEINPGRSNGVPHISSKEIENLLFPLPPLSEQQRIVAKVQQLQQQLSQLETQVQQSRQYAQQLLQSVLKEAFEQKGKEYEMEEEVLTMVAED